MVDLCAAIVHCQKIMDVGFGSKISRVKVFEPFQEEKNSSHIPPTNPTRLLEITARAQRRGDWFQPPSAWRQNTLRYVCGSNCTSFLRGGQKLDIDKNASKRTWWWLVWVIFQGVTFPIPHTDSLITSGSIPYKTAICHPRNRKNAELQW